jgi:hypothetical protein
MGDIIIYPSNIVRQPGRIPKIDFSNTGTITLQVISGATIQFGTNTLFVAISNSAISGSTINVGNLFSV